MPSLGWSPANIRINFASPETKMISYLMLKTARSYLHSSGRNTGMWRTDEQTEFIWPVPPVMFGFNYESHARVYQISAQSEMYGWVIDDLTSFPARSLEGSKWACSSPSWVDRHISNLESQLHRPIVVAEFGALCSQRIAVDFRLLLRFEMTATQRRLKSKNWGKICIFYPCKN